MKREDIPSLLQLHGEKIVELGVDECIFTEQLAIRYPKKHIYAVDKWNGDGRDGQTFSRVVDKLRPYSPQISFFRGTFEVVCKMFSDEYFDMIYIDGFAHTGQDNGKTLDLWWPKLRQGGIFSGHDYCDKYLATKLVVNKFAEKHGLTIEVTDEKDLPSWYCFKPGV